MCLEMRESGWRERRGGGGGGSDVKEVLATCTVSGDISSIRPTTYVVASSIPRLAVHYLAPNFERFTFPMVFE